MHACVFSHLSCPTLCSPMDCKPSRLLCPWDSPGKNTGVSCHALLQGIFPTQGLNPHLLTSPTLAGGFFTTSATWEAHRFLYKSPYFYPLLLLFMPLRSSILNIFSRYFCKQSPGGILVHCKNVHILTHACTIWLSELFFLSIQAFSTTILT